MEMNPLKCVRSAVGGNHPGEVTELHFGLRGEGCRLGFVWNYHAFFSMPFDWAGHERYRGGGSPLASLFSHLVPFHCSIDIYITDESAMY